MCYNCICAFIFYCIFLFIRIAVLDGTAITVMQECFQKKGIPLLDSLNSETFVYYI